MDDSLSRSCRQPRARSGTGSRTRSGAGPLALTHLASRSSLDAMTDLKIPTVSPLPATAPESPYKDLLGATSRMQRLFRLIQRVAPSESTILLTGESGTGKELVARAIHLQSKRAQGPFVPVHCGAIPEGLIESELFGYARGAFTGATSSRRGLIEESDRGTLFLDEIAETPLSTQVKLLRFLESNEVRRLGENDTRIVDCRVVAATNKDLSKAVAAGEFREDLFYRLNVVHLEIPPLRERREDVPLLAAYFLERTAAKAGKKVRGFSPEAQRLLVQWDYPGNVRELENAIERAVALAEGDVIQADDLPPVFSQARLLPEGRVSAEDRDAWTLEQVERDHIARVLARHRGNLAHAARQLGISRTTLWRKLRRERGAEPKKTKS
ncbi:MAG TPA: sigma-54 dependent transcriptional regulator [Candidatus Eisenbacteria bacterium]|nr:sigma-54 dependent transcriptional regulator [Candidatus Eisenbacteria bacterium]